MSCMPSLSISPCYYPDWGFHPHFHLIRTACVKFQTSGCGVLLFLVLLAGVMASIKHKRVVRTI